MRLALALLLTALTAAVAFAHQGATGIVKQRMDAMKDTADAMKAVGPMMKGEAPLDRDMLSASASTIAGHARDMPALFPQGSLDHPTEAVPAIWQDWDDFVALADSLAEQADALAADADAGAAIEVLRARFGEVAESCKACHEDYRIKAR